MINEANNFFSEIEYYESRGNYVLADKLTKSFLKIAYQANISDIGKDYSEAFADKFSLDVIYYYASLIPECLEVSKSDPNLLPFLAKDYKDLVYEKTQSGKDVDSAAYEAAEEMETSYEQRMNLDQFIKGDKDLAGKNLKSLKIWIQQIQLIQKTQQKLQLLLQELCLRYQLSNFLYNLDCVIKMPIL